MTHEMIKRVAAVIAAPSKWYVVKFDVDNECWHIVLLEGGVFTYVVNGDDHDAAEELCEKMNNELLARLVIDAMRDLYRHVPGPVGNQEDHLKLNVAIDQVLK